MYILYLGYNESFKLKRWNRKTNRASNFERTRTPPAWKRKDNAKNETTSQCRLSTSPLSCHAGATFMPPTRVGSGGVQDGYGEMSPIPRVVVKMFGAGSLAVD